MGADSPVRHEALRLRARLNALIRGFFAERHVAEVETPILSRARYLRTSPEYPLKRLLAEGFGDCHELGRVFRNGEAGASHNPEFTMLEWYRIGFYHRRLMLECAQFVRIALALVERDADVATLSYREWFRRGLGLDPFAADERALREPLAEFHIDPEG